MDGEALGRGQIDPVGREQVVRAGEPGLGRMTMAYGSDTDDEQSIATIRRAHEVGVTMSDTAGARQPLPRRPPALLVSGGR